MTAGRCCMLTSLWLVAMSAIAPAQEFPARPVKIITDSAPGSAIDVILRVIADRLGQIWGQQVLPVNQPGAGGSLAGRLAAPSPADGYPVFLPCGAPLLPGP